MILTERNEDVDLDPNLKILKMSLLKFLRTQKLFKKKIKEQDVKLKKKIFYRKNMFFFFSLIDWDLKN